MSKIKVTVSKVSTEPTKNKNFIHTVKTEGKEVEVLGQKKMSGQLTYFIALPGITPVGTESEIDMNMFSITERPFTPLTVDGLPESDENGETIVHQLKWLHIK